MLLPLTLVASSPLSIIFWAETCYKLPIGANLQEQGTAGWGTVQMVNEATLYSYFSGRVKTVTILTSKVQYHNEPLKILEYRNL